MAVASSPPHVLFGARAAAATPSVSGQAIPSSSSLRGRHWPAQSPLVAQPWRAPCRTRRRFRAPQAGTPRAGRESPYEVLGVPRTASEKDIKRAYRKLALKFHPDVNKAADAQQQFMRVKQAYQALTEPSSLSGAWASSQRASTSPRAGSSWGAAPDFDFNWKKGPQEPFYGLDDFFRDLAEDLEKRKKEGKPKSLWQELADLGEEFIEYLETELNVVEDKTGETSSGSGQRREKSSSQSQSGRNTGSSQRSSTSDDDRKYSAWAEELGKKSKEVADDIESELQKLKKELGL